MDFTSTTVECKLASMVTAEDVKHWRSESFIDHEFHEASDWTVHVVDAIIAGRGLLDQARSDVAFREARYEAAELFARAS